MRFRRRRFRSFRGRSRRRLRRGGGVRRRSLRIGFRM